MKATMPYNERKARDMDRAMYPHPGDSWHDMYCPVFQVLEVSDRCVVFTEEYETTDSGGWRWKDNPTKLLVLSREDFVKRLTYEHSPQLGLWASCARKEQCRD